RGHVEWVGTPPRKKFRCAEVDGIDLGSIRCQVPVLIELDVADLVWADASEVNLDAGTIEPSAPTSIEQHNHILRVPLHRDNAATGASVITANAEGIVERFGCVQQINPNNHSPALTGSQSSWKSLSRRFGSP